MQVTFPPAGVGWVLALLVLVLCFVALVGAVSMTPTLILWSLILLALARLI